MIKRENTQPRTKCVNEDCQAILEPNQKFCGDCGANQRVRRIAAAASNQPHSTQDTEDGKLCRKDSSEDITVQLPAHLICQLCSKPYKEPRILPCLHSFCEQCLHTKIEMSGTKQSIECPTCQRSVIIPEGRVTAIHHNLHLGYEVEVARHVSKISSAGDKSCDVCVNGDTGPAVVFCCRCLKLLCSYCHEYHKHSRDLCNHEMVALDKELLNHLPSLKIPTEHFCSNHKEKKLKFYCDTCQHLVCKYCTITLHKDHKITEICNIAKVHREGMREAFECAQEVISKLTRAINANKNMAEVVRTSIEEATQLVKETFEKLHQTIEERKKTLLSKIAAISDSKTTALTLHKEQLMHVQDEISHYTEMTSHILQTYTDQEVAAFRDLLPNELKAIKEKVENMPLNPDQPSDIHVSLDSGPLIKELSIYGHVMDSAPSPSKSTWSSKSVAWVNKVYCIEVETKTSSGSMCDCGGLQVKGELRPKSHDGAVVNGATEDHEDGTYTITLTPQSGGPHQLHITVDGEVVEGSPCDLDVRSYLNLCKPQQNIDSRVQGPSSIAIDDSGDIYVASCVSNNISVFDPTGLQLKRTIGNKGNCNGQFNKPYGIFIKGDVLFVADHDNHRIQKLKTDGKLINKFGQYGSGQGQFYGPISVIVDQMDRMIVSDHYNHRVVIMDQAGNWLSTINGNVSGSSEFQTPYGLALDPQGNIHVAANGSNTIKVFTLAGTYVKSYGNVKGPSGIAIDKDGYSLVCAMQHRRFYIFHPQGNCIHTVCNLDQPRDVLLDLNNGSLYVANSNANAVLKYYL